MKVFLFVTIDYVNLSYVDSAGRQNQDLIIKLYLRKTVGSLEGQWENIGFKLMIINIE